MDVVMPSFAGNITEATILRWLVEDGEKVVAGQGLAEIDVDKVTVVLEAQEEGFFSLVVEEGETVVFGDVVATVEGESV